MLPGPSTFWYLAPSSTSPPDKALHMTAKAIANSRVFLAA
jgi:hypothetical protein